MFKRCLLFKNYIIAHYNFLRIAYRLILGIQIFDLSGICYSVKTKAVTSNIYVFTNNNNLPQCYLLNSSDLI